MTAGVEAMYRVSPRFSASGRYATSVIADADGRFAMESWALSSAGPQKRFHVPVAEPVWSLGLPLDDGRTILVKHGSKTHDLTVLDAHGQRSDAPIQVPSCQLLPPPPGSSAVAIGLYRRDAGSRVLLIRQEESIEVAVIDASLPVRGWTIGESELLLATGDGTAYLLDLRIGRIERLPAEVLPPEALVLAVSAHKLLLTHPGEASSRLFIGSLTGPPQELALPATPGLANPVAINPNADQVALVVEQGAATQLLLVDDDSARLIEHGNTSMAPCAGWTDYGLWGIGSSPDRPPSYFWLPPAATALRWSAPAEDGPPVRLATVPGAAGDLEAVVYGPAWTDAAQVILALHGGPRDHWRAGYDRSLRLLAAEGICVIAVNQRGSTGYGNEMELAIKGCWGGPDLADILAVASWLRTSGCASPGLLGISYGAFLALLAAAADPDGWACCAAIAPFTSADRLYATAGPGVRALIDRLDATRPIQDELGPRDLLRLAPRIRCPTLIAHGRRDPVIPVGHAREIAAAMAAGGNPPQLKYLELPDRGHAVLRANSNDIVLRAALTLFGKARARRGNPHRPSSKLQLVPEGGDIHGDQSRVTSAAAC